ncbi:peptide-methionine (S)-S-oxide reductase MsrA [Phaeovibrio sulfidiphilus]|uniref:peptide-methionine (S)-S-oxide reductase MsrA n=1 Tax=Phaeovibrio sulfidiphilus TaxID=1220600 RepID=UPI0018D76DC9|nr:peptide-methionine (S)-S-oxide reductase MsrA [Phaeovibrio sulfidiphilus]
MTTPQPKTAIFAGGCFWGLEHLFRSVDGVLDADSGYSGGHVPNPSYRQVCTGTTGHAEAVRVTYDPSRVSYADLAKAFFEFHDPTQLNRQGPDIGTQYRSVLFYADEAEHEAGRELVRLLTDSGYRVATALEPRAPFWRAEEEHQNYLAKHPLRGCHIPVRRFRQ